MYERILVPVTVLHRLIVPSIEAVRNSFVEKTNLVEVIMFVWAWNYFWLLNLPREVNKVATWFLSQTISNSLSWENAKAQAGNLFSLRLLVSIPFYKFHILIYRSPPVVVKISPYGLKTIVIISSEWATNFFKTIVGSSKFSYEL